MSDNQKQNLQLDQRRVHMKTLLMAYTVLIFLMATGCMKISKKGADKTTSQPKVVDTTEMATSPSIQSPDSPKQDFFELKNDRFDFVVSNEKVDFHFPETWPLDIYVEFTINQNKMMIPIKNEKFWSFKWPIQNQKIQFRFFSSSDFSTKPLKSIQILPELNLEISETYDLASTWNLNSEVEKIYFDELVLNRNSKLLLGSFSGQIYIKKLRSEDGSIQSFESFSKAAPDQNGRSGGFVEFIVKSAKGSLILFSLGEHGGDGSPGRSPDASIKGIRGRDGVRSTFQVEVPYCAINPNCFPIPTVVCMTPPGPGTAGAQGDRGYDGQPGKDGGNSGRYYLAFPVEGLNVLELSRAGSAGQGGHGGFGGEGGEGGDGGDGEWLDYLITKAKMKKEDAIRELNKVPQVVVAGLGIKKCESAAKGANGQRGPDGFRGANGMDGANQGKK